MSRQEIYKITLNSEKLDDDCFDSYDPCSKPLSAVHTCVLAGPCRSAVTVAEEAAGTSSVGDFTGAGLAFLRSAGGSTVLGVGVLLPPVNACWP